ncbi:MAG: hypothetical protein IKP90_02495 [Fibrobacter sp.]|nr:hypothetical protein [Fibrobacter sp.]MBR6124903.1 hypothetical protein [Candidatus Saccharibacteria bacterium]
MPENKIKHLLFRLVLPAILMLFFTSCIEVEHHVYGSKNDIKIQYEILANHSMVQISDNETGGEIMSDMADKFRSVSKGMIVKESLREKDGELYDVVSGTFSIKDKRNDFSAYEPLFEKDQMLIPTPFDNSEWDNDNSYMVANSKYSVFVAKSLFPNASAAYTVRPNGKIREVDLKIRGDSYIIDLPILWWLNGNVAGVILAK